MVEPEDPSRRPQDPFDAPRAEGPTQPYSAYPAPTHVGPPPNPWKPAAIVLGVVVAVESLLLVGILAAGFFAVSGDLTSIELDEAVVDPCSEMLDAAYAVPLLAGPEESQEPLRDLARAADELATTGDRAARNDADRQWVTDWRELATALDDLAEDPSQPFSLPVRDGTPVTVPLALNGPFDCEPPPVLTALDPEAPGALYVDDASDYF